MLSGRRWFLFACLVLLALPSAGADAVATSFLSAWDQGHKSRARLVIAMDVEAGMLARAKQAARGQAMSVEALAQPAVLAGVQIELAKGFKTYWRHPGTDGGVPPEFDWSKSDNIQSVYVGFPAPQRFNGEAGYAIGYKRGVVFPLIVVPGNRMRPAILRLNLFYGVCKDICIPAEAVLTHTIPALEPAGVLGFGRPRADKTGRAVTASGPEQIARGRLLDAVEALPAPMAIDAQQDGQVPRVVATRVVAAPGESDAHQVDLQLDVDFGTSVFRDVFVEAPTGLRVGSVRKLSGMSSRYAVRLLDPKDWGPPHVRDGVSVEVRNVTVTLVSDRGNRVRIVNITCDEPCR